MAHPERTQEEEDEEKKKERETACIPSSSLTVSLGGEMEQNMIR
jgi:hypothetical protein